MTHAEVREDERVRANIKLARLTAELAGVDSDTLRAADPDVLRSFSERYTPLANFLVSMDVNV